MFLPNVVMVLDVGSHRFFFFFFFFFYKFTKASQKDALTVICT